MPLTTLPQNTKAVLITGASTGLGWSSTEALVNRGIKVFATVRREQDAEKLQKIFAGNVIPLILDVTDEATVMAAAEQVRKLLDGYTLWGLVNNAGIAIEGPLIHLSTEQFRHQLEVNLIGIHTITRAFVPLLGTDRQLNGMPGRIINISSVGGKIGIPFMGAYVASKHGLEGYSETLRRELLIYGIHVIIVAPGYVNTPIWDKLEANEASPFDDTEYKDSIRRFKQKMTSEGREGLSPQALGEVVWVALNCAKPKARYAPIQNKLRNWTIPRLLPLRWLDRAIAADMGLNKIK